MKGLHHQIAQQRKALEIDRAAAKSIHADPRDAHEAEHRANEGERKLTQLATAAHHGESAHADLAKALARIEEIAPCDRDRELSLAISYSETALWRLRRYLGKPEAI